MILFLSICVFVAGLCVRTWRRTLVAAGVATLLVLGGLALTLLGVAMSRPVADPAGGLAQAGGYVVAQVLVAGIAFLTAACIGHGLRRLFVRTGVPPGR